MPPINASDEMYKECPPIDSCHEPCRILVEISNITIGNRCPQCQCTPTEQSPSMEITLANVTVVEEEDTKKDKKNNLPPETATLLTMLEPKKVDIKRESKQKEIDSIATKNIEKKIEEVITTTSKAIIENSMPSMQQINEPATDAPAILPSITTSTALGQKCPAVECEFPCVIYRDPSSECPSCSCSNPNKDRKNIHLASKLTFN